MPVKMVRLRILAAAASYQGSLVYTCTEGQVCWAGVANAMDMVGMVTPPDTLIVMSRVIAFMVMVTVDHALTGRAWVVLSSA